MVLQNVIEADPWSFSSHLLVLKEWTPNTPTHYYDFLRCTFWIHFLGKPFERVTEEIIHIMASKLGKVQEVCLDYRGTSNPKLGKAQIELILEDLLKTGTFLSIEGVKTWVEFKYKHLPHYCYSCRRMSRYAQYCKLNSYVESGLEENKRGKFGPWLKVEVRECSPYWDFFYNEETPAPKDEEVILEPNSTTHTRWIISRRGNLLLLSINGTLL